MGWVCAECGTEFATDGWCRDCNRLLAQVSQVIAHFGVDWRRTCFGHPLADVPRLPLVVAYGMGVDSTAVLVGFAVLGIRPNKILFADTGSEKPETYAYLPVIQAWLASVGFPAVEVVRYRPRHGLYDSLEGNCLVNETLPSLAFGFKSCSMKWKREPQDKHVNGWQPARDAWARGHKVVKVIGYDAGPKDSRRAWKMTDDAKYAYWYPLRDWGWDRERCEREIQAAGLPVPPKSACFFCPATQPAELDVLMVEHPELVDRILAMEARAKPHLNKVEGLWRKATRNRPGSMTEYVQRVRLRVVEG